MEKEQKVHESILVFLRWCDLMEIKPYKIESILEYRRICQMMKA